MKKFLTTSKKLLVMLLTISLLLVLAACGSAGEEAQAKPEPITLTTENIGDYISIRGEYKNGDYHAGILFYTSTADSDFQAYSTVSGSFENVEITVRANLKDKEGSLGEQWHLVDSENKDNVEFTFKLPASGEYTSSYSIECDRNTWSLSGNSELEIVAVSGSYTPNAQ